MRLLSIATFVLGLGLAATAAAECARDPAPTVPDGAVASLEEMKAAQQAVKAYQTKNGSYLACLEAEAQRAPADEAAEAKAARVASYNTAVDEETALAERFNKSVQAYKARK